MKENSMLTSKRCFLILLDGALTQTRWSEKFW